MVGDAQFNGHGCKWLLWQVIVVVVFSVLVSQSRAGTLALTGGQSIKFATVWRELQEHPDVA
jgi:hypothetical protein